MSAQTLTVSPRLAVPGRRRRQAGFSLAAMALTLALTTATAIWASNEVVHAIEASAARSSGVWMGQIRQAVAGVLERHFDALAKGENPVGGQGAALYADAYRPTLAELRSQGHLPADFPGHSTMGFGVQIRIVRAPTCPGGACRLDGVVYTDKPVSRNGIQIPDPITMASIIEAADGYGGAVWPQAPAQLRGAAFSFSNPLAPGERIYAPGTLALWAGAGAGSGQPDLSAYVKQQDLSGYVRQSELNAFVRMRDVRNPDLQGALTVAGPVHAGSHLTIGARAVPGHYCAVAPGALASSYQGELLACQANVWTQASGGFGGAFSVNWPLGCMHYTGVSTANPRTGQCSCPPGFAGVIVSAGGKWTETEGWTTGYVCVR